MGRWGVRSLLGAAFLLPAGAAIAADDVRYNNPAWHLETIRAAKLELAQATSAPSSAAQDDGRTNTNRQDAVLLEEDPGNPTGERIPGFVVWRTEPVDTDTKLDVALRADVEIPDRRLKMTMVFRRNTDPTLPASHTVEIRFTLPADFAGGGIVRIPGMLVKSNEKTKGVPLAAASARVLDGIFLIGLSKVDVDRTRNLQLLRESTWLDIPIFYATKRRAVLAIEQASPRHKPFETAFGFWEQTSLVGPK